MDWLQKRTKANLDTTFKERHITKADICDIVLVKIAWPARERYLLGVNKKSIWSPSLES